MSKLKERERTAIINSLRSGVVPRIGLHHIQVGRNDEVSEIIKDIEKLSKQSSSIRLIIGDYGSGKSFFLNLSNTIAHTYNAITSIADISMEKTLYSRDGKARALYTEIIKGLSTKSRPDGNALRTIIDSWISKTIGIEEDVPKEKIYKELAHLRELVSGYDFSDIICQYYDGYINDDEILCENCLRWLRGEYATKTDAKKDLPVTGIVDDRNYYDYLKIIAEFVRMAGYSGLVICIDELAVLTRLQSNVRAKNYETILKMLNDILQGNVNGISLVLSGTPEFLKDKRKGLYSYGALESRLSSNSFSRGEFKDLSGPVIELDNLSQEELFLVFGNIRNVFAYHDTAKHLIDDKGIVIFMEKLFSRMGAASYLSPREAIKDFVHVLNLAESHPDKGWEFFLTEANSDALEQTTQAGTNDLNSFKL
ncbi:MAG: ATP-binding protein [Leptospirales bacterium]